MLKPFSKTKFKLLDPICKNIEKSKTEIKMDETNVGSHGTENRFRFGWFGINCRFRQFGSKWFRLTVPSSVLPVQGKSLLAYPDRHFLGLSLELESGPFWNLAKRLRAEEGWMGGWPRLGNSLA